jgi:hypothetical protein
MNTLVVYAAIILVIIIVVIAMSMKIKKQIESSMFDKVEGYDNIFKNLKFVNGLTVTENETQLTEVDESSDSLISELNVGSVVSTSTDMLLTDEETILNLDEHASISKQLNGGYDFMESTSGSKFDKTKDYIYAVYVKRRSDSELDDGNIYWGPRAGDMEKLNLENGSGSQGGNPYFSSLAARRFLPETWHLMIGVVRNSNSSITDTSIHTGVYRLSDKVKLESTNSSDYIIGPEAEKIGLRTFLFYDDDNPDGIITLVSFSRPFVYEVDEVTEDIMSKFVQKLLGP